MLAKEGAPPIGSDEALAAIECARFRGSKFGAGFAGFKISGDDYRYARVKVFVLDESAYRDARRILESYNKQGLRIVEEIAPDFAAASTMATWEAIVDAEDSVLFHAAMDLNGQMYQDGVHRARVYSSSRYHNTFKGVGYPTDVAEEYRILDPVLEARMWIAHTRQPTNSPGMYPIWSHPFSVMEWSIVHNGDVSSFGTNITFLQGYGVKNFVGTDSEVICYLLDHLVRVEGLSLPEAALALTAPYERWWPRVEADVGVSEKRVRELCIQFLGAHLDGPFAVVAGHADADDVQMLGLIDRSKFRPLIVGEDDERIYLASEECEIRVLSPKARVWACDPGRYVLATGKEGFIENGLAPNRVMVEFTGLSPVPEVRADAVIDATGLAYETLLGEIRAAIHNGAKTIYIHHVRGQRYIGVGVPKGIHLILDGTPGNCLANFNDGADITVYGNTADDVADTMHDGTIIIHGSARDVLGQALQGGRIYVRGDIGNRGGILMREYADKRPIIMVGGRAGNYLGEYMAGGIIAVLGLAELEAGSDAQIVGDFVAPGMLGGWIYIRGRVDLNHIGSLPHRQDVENYLEVLALEGEIDQQTYEEVLALPALTLDTLAEVLPDRALELVRRMYDSKYRLPLNIRYDYLDEEDLSRLQPHIDEFFRVFGLSERLKERLLSEKFTRIFPIPKKPKPGDPEPIAEE
ncbi:MAG: glutamate synthase [Candidatus Poribacteria bacterium]|nr:MAG: glutamate synthase [Candidatus Poribacteria bacterium]